MRGERDILLTGGTGFLGSNLLHRLVAEGYSIILLKRSTSDLRRIGDLVGKIIMYDGDLVPLARIFADHRIGTVIHCATHYGRRELDPVALLEANLILPVQLLQLGVKHDLACFINTDTILDKRVNCYSLSKDQFRVWLQLFASRMSCINVALEHFFGPYDDESKFVTAIVRQLLAGAERIDLTQGEQKRDFIFIDDVVEAMLTIFLQRYDFGTGYHDFEIGSGNTISIRDFVTLVQKLAGNDRTQLNFGALPYRENEVMESKVDISKLSALGWQPRTSLEDGLMKTIQRERERQIP